MSHSKIASIIGTVLLTLSGSGASLAQEPMTFFITSVGPGMGGNLGGLAGADAHCQMLAEEAGAGNRTWRAYLSTQGGNAVNARDRIGTGPWHNADGDLIANNLTELHSMLHRLTVAVVIDEEGNRIPGSGYSPNRHDTLTGSQENGMAYPAGEDMTCNNWTSSDNGKARVGHHDRAAWNSAHNSAGCSQQALIGTGGDGLYYCFAQ